MTIVDRRSVVAAGLGLTAVMAAPALARPRGFFARHHLPIGVQLYTVSGEVAKDLDGTFARLAGIGFRTLELAGYFGHTPEALRAAADKAGLRFTSAHVQDTARGKDIGLDSDSARIAADMRILGVADVVLPMPPFPRTGRPQPGEKIPDYISRMMTEGGVDMWKRTAALLNSRGEALQREGLRLGYHNHNVEFAPVGGTTGLDILMRETDRRLVGFEMDAGWVVAAGVDPIALLRRYPGRFRQMHVKDVQPSTKANFAMQQDPIEVGGGVIFWAGLLPAAYAAGVRQFYVEQEPPFAGSRLDAVAKSYAFLANDL